MPTGLLKTASTTSSVSVSWNASTDNVGVSGYLVLVNGNFSTATTSRTNTVAPLGCGVTVTVGISAFDAALNFSAVASAVVSTSPCTGADTTPPSAPAGLAKTGSTATSLTVGWSPSTDNVGVAGYVVLVNGALVTSTVPASVTLGMLACGTTYTVGVAAMDAAMNFSALSAVQASTSSCSGPDTTAPTTPANFTATAQAGPQVALHWSASIDNVGVVGYRVYRNGVQIGSSGGTSYTDTAVTPGSTYSYYVRAYDLAGNTSPPSSQPSVTIPGTGGDTSAPTAPTNLHAGVQAGPRVALTWNASFDNKGVAGYRIYRNSTLVGTSATASYTDSTVTSGRSYVYNVRAYDAAGNLSVASNTVAVTT